MRQKINQYLDLLEKEKQIKILLACETGSRAWGFPSPDSDYDIRLLYVHQQDWYLSLTEKKDSIERMYENNDIDITGWDLRKSLRLLKKSNAALLERIQSPILYRHDEAFLKDIKGHALNHYSRIATLHHYLSLAKKCHFEISEQKEYKLKKFFYALRSATACKWILEKEALVPIEFSVMLEVLDIDQQVLHRVSELIQLKGTVSEAYLHSEEELIFQFMEDCITTAKAKSDTLPAAKANGDVLDDFFRKTIQLI